MVFDQDPACLHSSGPVAVKYAKVEDESIEDIFGNTALAPVDELIDRVYGGDSSKISAIAIWARSLQQFRSRRALR